ncbi:5679_t:CDS:2 [Paraglomus brasilianum]|uniref:5679_t:CDS:1 n=1 Tax=Paraglomus brasilianum TaxID=144538 RepID=A0A9N9EZA6_9GLOM|nr:5679_t:CDS:2 [Paraglomus brasilianum]
MPYGPEGKWANPPSSRPILITTVWDAVALLWTYSISRPPKVKTITNSTSHDKSNIFHSEEQHKELPFRSINSWHAGRDESRERTDIRNEQGGSREESKNDEIDVFQCPNRGKNEGLQEFLGPLLRVGTMVGSSWEENYPKSPCYFVLPDSRPKWIYNCSMPSVSNRNRFDSSGNNPSVVVEMIANESDRCRIATSLDIQIQNCDLRKDHIAHYVKEIALCGFNHIIVIGIIGTCDCGLLFLDCVFRWDSMNGLLLFFGKIFKAVSEKSCEEAVWMVSGDGNLMIYWIELWSYEWEEDKKPETMTASCEDRNNAIKAVENQFPFLCYRNSSNGFDTFDRTLSTICQICEKEHTRDGMYGRWHGSCYFLYCYRQKRGESGIEITRADHNKKKVIPRLEKLRSRLQHSSQSLSQRYRQNNFTAVGKNVEIYNAEVMRSYNLQAKLLSRRRHLMLVKGHCKSNRTAEEIRELYRPDRSSVSTLIISGRRSLAHGQKTLFDGFKSYLDLDIRKLNPKDTPQLIISPESIHKLGTTGYDVIILMNLKQLPRILADPL